MGVPGVKTILDELQTMLGFQIPLKMKLFLLHDFKMQHEWYLTPMLQQAKKYNS